MTGAELVRRLHREAVRQSVPLAQFVRPLSADPHAFVRHLKMAARPMSATIARVEALIAGRALPPIGRKKPTFRPRPPKVRDRRPIDPVPTSAPVFRDPCPRCGVRADIGCGHSGRALSSRFF